LVESYETMEKAFTGFYSCFLHELTNSSRRQEATLAFKIATEIPIDKIHFHEGGVMRLLANNGEHFILFFPSPKKYRGVLRQHSIVMSLCARETIADAESLSIE
jgi:hypothetical protein